MKSFRIKSRHHVRTVLSVDFFLFFAFASPPLIRIQLISSSHICSHSAAPKRFVRIALFGLAVSEVSVFVRIYEYYIDRHALRERSFVVSRSCRSISPCTVNLTFIVFFSLYGCYLYSSLISFDRQRFFFAMRSSVSFSFYVRSFKYGNSENRIG